MPALWQPLKLSGEHQPWVWQLCFLALAHLPLFTRRVHPESFQLPIRSVAMACADIKQGCQEGCGVVADPGVSPASCWSGWVCVCELWSHLLPFCYSCFCHLHELLPGSSAASSCCSTWNEGWGFLLSRGFSSCWNKQEELCESLNQTAVSLFAVY